MELYAEVEIKLKKENCRFHKSMCVSLASVLMEKNGEGYAV